ncbi:hypothetical protein EDEG_03836 [Edhazardia aedis USNM 41457]|uniref:Uncharacterized protein n=1 Tax=Edhazardia aedis (strain USNM 41457) TaxID=1003232 RepID=J9DGA2_EDHAE|nr:hypothetical protein EDEG_03836 [Edhazardia aedis USNM 41457]|eukprot:EJW01620.1 hypothetical protein EDEG_03836 [Edhazardia aedis USNM 41457]
MKRDKLSINVAIYYLYFLSLFYAFIFSRILILQYQYPTTNICVILIFCKLFIRKKISCFLELTSLCLNIIISVHLKVFTDKRKKNIILPAFYKKIPIDLEFYIEYYFNKLNQNLK